MTYMMVATYWQKMELIGSMLSFLTIVFAILFCFCHRNIIHAAVMSLDEIQPIYKTDAAHINMMLEQYIFTLSPPPFDSKEEGQAKVIMTLSILTVVIITVLGYFHL